jgi:hypothetical protein
MARIIGGLLGMLALVIAIVQGLIYHIPAETVLVRGLMAFWIGFLAGWIVFGQLGISLVHSATEAKPQESLPSGEGQKGEPK